MCFAESSCVFQASELTKRHSNNQFVLFVLATKDNHEFHTNSNKLISIHLKRSGAAMFAENCRMVCFCSDIKLLNKKDLSIQAALKRKVLFCWRAHARTKVKLIPYLYRSGDTRTENILLIPSLIQERIVSDSSAWNAINKTLNKNDSEESFVKKMLGHCFDDARIVTEN